MSDLPLNKPNHQLNTAQASNHHDPVINNRTTAGRIATFTDAPSRYESGTHKPSQTIRTTCPYCGVGCGVLASVDKAGYISVAGDTDHPANFGKLCSKGSALAQTLASDRRITTPYYQNKPLSMAQTQDDQMPSAQSATQPAEWDTVLDDIAARLNNTIAQHGRDSIMFYVSGQLLTEDYYVANKFIKGFIGNNNIDSNSRLCMSSAVAGHKRAFGADIVPGNYEDLEACDLLVLVGSNMAWCHPILFGRFLAAKKADPDKKLIVIDPRRTDSCAFADLHLPIAAGTDTHLYNGLLHYLNEHGCTDNAFIVNTVGVNEALAAAKDWSIERVAKACQVSSASILKFYQLVARHDKTVTAFSMGVNQSKSGTDKVNAIINTHLLTGRVGKVGASPFSLTGQPNAMGGREVGALANLLAAHLDLDNRTHRQLVADFWHAPQPIASTAGIQACDAADAILDGRIKAIWIMATNPVVSLPEADKFRRALAACELVIVSDCSVDSDTVKCADIVLPAQGWGEKSGTVTNSERRISRQRTLMPALGLAKPDWWILSQVATRMGLAGFDYQHPSEIFNEHMALTAVKNDPSQPASARNQPRYLNLPTDILNQPRSLQPDLDHQGSSLASLSRDDYDLMTPFQWGGARIVSLQANFVAITPLADASVSNMSQRRHQRQRHYSTSKLAANDLNKTSDHKRATLDSDKSLTVPLRLITGRLRDQWHTMTRTGLAPQLNQHQSVPTLTIHPNDANVLNINDGDYVQLHPCYKDDEQSEEKNKEKNKKQATALHEDAKVFAHVAISDSMRIGDAFMPMHWSDAFASFARVGTLIPTLVDPHSGQPELKNSAIRISRVPMQTFGKILVHTDLQDAILVHLRSINSRFTQQQQDQLSSQLVEQASCSTLNTKSEPSSLTLPALPALTWSISRQANSVEITLASPLNSVAEHLLDPNFWQQFVDSYQSRLDDKPLCSSAFTLSKPTGQLRFVTMQTPVNKEAIISLPNFSAISASTTASEQLLLAIYFAPKVAKLPSSHWLDSCFTSTDAIPAAQRDKWLLAGRPATGYIDPGPLVCSCMAVGENIIISAITKEHCRSAQAVGKACRAGTNCGSCIGQINTLIAAHVS